ncbi:DNA polymerase epsilon subunit 4-like [Bradysia coprophila]|uniref:DNA polymerase epsilon subunit 4-like n=1 Tax=Bradysia coprophila TaxID=38358 RepID=UPI00187D8398|nr:DNA polymerase epsilon subunit 4-like [Bradysia coprophila]
MDSHTNYEDFDDMENPEDFTESQGIPSEDQHVNVEKVVEERLCQLPFSRIKSIMKLDPELNLVSSDSVFLMSKVTELFIKSLARESFVFVEQGKKKTVQKKDVDMAINAVDALMFLEGALDFN